MALSAQQIEQYRRDGFVCPVPVMPAAEAAGLRRRLEAFEASQGGSLEPGQRSRAFLLFKWLDDLIRDPRVLDPIEQLIGPDILCWSTIFWIKDAGSKSFVSWHQDNTYWGLSSRNVVTAWFAISDASLAAGCMRVLPGSHLGKTLVHEDTYHADNMLTRGQTIGGIDESRAVAMPLRAGEMSLHNYCLAHGSGPNLSDDRRIGVSMHFMPPATQQVVGSWDCAALVRGKDPKRNFEHTPIPAKDFDPVAVAFHARAARALREVLYAGAEKNPQRL
ncbi:MAG: phytanoyl-CoA dioxygenase family protein [Burkholderiales bacterium]